jgi:asparagine synthase (glutamine-hydrolysing)
MAFSREIRVPFLSHHLTEFIFSLPIDFIFNEGWTKYILRKSIEGIVPDDITWRKDKVGYEPPQEKWLQKLLPFYEGFKKKSNYLDFTGGKKVKEADLTNWKWLMLKLYME